MCTLWMLMGRNEWCGNVGDMLKMLILGSVEDFECWSGEDVSVGAVMGIEEGD